MDPFFSTCLIAMAFVGFISTPWVLLANRGLVVRCLYCAMTTAAYAILALSILAHG